MTFLGIKEDLRGLNVVFVVESYFLGNVIQYRIDRSRRGGRTKFLCEMKDITYLDTSISNFNYYVHVGDDR